jgi:hypothetical protein
MLSHENVNVPWQYITDLPVPLYARLTRKAGCPSQALFRRNQLKALVDIHKRDGKFEGGLLTEDEISIIHGALDLASKCASAAMTPMDQVRGSIPWQTMPGLCGFFGLSCISVDM